MRFRERKRLAYGHTAWRSQRPGGAQAASCSGRAAALPRHLLCPTQVAAVPMPSCQGKWMLNKDPNRRVRTQKVLAQSC